VSFLSVLVISTFLTIDLHTIKFESNLVEFKRNAIFTALDPAISLFIVSLPSMYRKLSHGNVYRSCCCIGILIAVSKRCVDEWNVCVNLELDDAIVEDYIVSDVKNVIV